MNVLIVIAKISTLFALLVNKLTRYLKKSNRKRQPWNGTFASVISVISRSDECPNCHCKDLNVIRTARQQIDEVPQEIKPKTTTVERDFCECNKRHFKI